MRAPARWLVAAVLGVFIPTGAGAVMTFYYPLSDEAIAEYEESAAEFLNGYVPEPVIVSVGYGVDYGARDEEGGQNAIEAIIAKSRLVEEPHRGYETILYREDGRWVVKDHKKWFSDESGPGDHWPVEFPACLDFVLAERIADHIRPLLHDDETLYRMEFEDDCSFPCIVRSWYRLEQRTWEREIHVGVIDGQLAALYSDDTEVDTTPSCIYEVPGE